MNNLIPIIMMLLLVISHTTAIYFLNKKRKALPTATPEGTAKDKQLRLLITILYIELPIITANIWLVIAPLLVPVDN